MSCRVSQMPVNCSSSEWCLVQLENVGLGLHLRNQQDERDDTSTGSGPNQFLSGTKLLNSVCPPSLPSVLPLLTLPSIPSPSVLPSTTASAHQHLFPFAPCAGAGCARGLEASSISKLCLPQASKTLPFISVINCGIHYIIGCRVLPPLALLPWVRRYTHPLPKKLSHTLASSRQPPLMLSKVSGCNISKMPPTRGWGG